MTTVARPLNEINVDRALLDQVLTIMGREAILSGNAALERAVERARQHIAYGIGWTLRGDILTVDSASTPGDQYSLSITSGCAGGIAPVRLHAGGTVGGRGWGRLLFTYDVYLVIGLYF